MPWAYRRAAPIDIGRSRAPGSSGPSRASLTIDEPHEKNPLQGGVLGGRFAPLRIETILTLSGATTMKRLVLATGALGALLVLAAHGRSGEDKNLAAIIDKAIAAHGGEANLAKYPAQTLTGTGKFYGLGEAIDYNIEIASHDKKFRYGMDMKVMNFDLKLTIVMSGVKGWEKVNDDVKEISADELAEYKEQMYSEAVVRL